MKSRIAPSSNLCLILEGIVIGLFAFWIIYGFGPLDVTNDRWIMSGYDESDIIQHYAGWVAFRNSSWHFPLGLADNMDAGFFISFTDSIPWLAVIFKLILKAVNYTGTFQYLGIYALLCYILQAVAAGLLIRRRTSSHFIICACMLLLCFSPILMERSLRHTTLGSQWFILFAMYAYLRFRDRECRGFPVSYAVLALLAVGIHPYFLPLILAFSFLSLLSCLYRRIDIAKNFWGFVWSVILPIAGGRLIGALGSGVNASRGGYGFYSMNLNALINPTSAGRYDWSNFLKVHPQILGNYDGFNYLGLGYLLLIILALLSLFIVLPRWNRYKTLDASFYALTALGMAAFAVSNVVTFNDKVLLTVPLPEALAKFCGIFRASSRLFYFVYYSLVIFSLYRIFDVIAHFNLAGDAEKKWICVSKKAVSFGLVISVICLVQLADLGHVIVQKHESMAQKLGFQSVIDDCALADAVKGKHFLISELGHDYYSYRVLAVLAGKNNLRTAFTVASDVEPYTETGNGHKVLVDFINGAHSDDVAIAYRDIGYARNLFQNENIRSYCKYLESNGFAFIIAGKDTGHSDGK